MRILVVEDTRDMNRLFVKVLAKAGYSVDGCFDGEEAQEYLLGASTTLGLPSPADRRHPWGHKNISLTFSGQPFQKAGPNFFH